MNSAFDFSLHEHYVRFAGVGSVIYLFMWFNTMKAPHITVAGLFCFCYSIGVKK